MANEAKTYAIFRDMLRSKGYYDDMKATGIVRRIDAGVIITPKPKK